MIKSGDAVKVRTGKRVWVVLVASSSSVILQGPKGEIESELIGDLTKARKADLTSAQLRTRV